jgi:flagellar FliL protein
MTRKMLVLFIILPTIIASIIAATFVVWNKISSENEKAAKKNIKKIISMYPLEAFIVNLADKGGKRFLRVAMHLELEDKNLAGEIDKRLSQIRNRILMILPTKRFEDISSTEGKIALRDEIMTKLNSLLKDGSITNIYFVEFVIQ